MSNMYALWDPPQKLPRGSISLGPADRPLCDAWHSSFHSGRNSVQLAPLSPDISHSEFCLADVPLSPDISHQELCPDDIPLSPDISQPQLCLADVPPSPDGREGRFNFPGLTYLDSSITLIRRTFVANDLDSPDSLARQTLAIHRIPFCPQSKSKLRQCWRPNLLHCQSSLMQDTLDKTFPSLLRLPDASPIFKVINWGDVHRLNTFLIAVTSHQKHHDYFATLCVAIMMMGPASTTRP